MPPFDPTFYPIYSGVYPLQIHQRDRAKFLCIIYKIYPLKSFRMRDVTATALRVQTNIPAIKSERIYYVGFR